MGKKYLIKCLCCDMPMTKPLRFKDLYVCSNCGARFFKSIERQGYAYPQEDDEEWNGNPT